jgi:hypothetical protein
MGCRANEVVHILNIMKLVTIFLYAFIGWTLCAPTMGIGLAIMPLPTSLTFHAMGATIFFMLVSVSYFKKFNDTTPLQKALLFVGIVITLDFFVVVLLIHRRLVMFTNLLGAWIPFAFIFASTSITGIYITRKPQHQAVAQ